MLTVTALVAAGCGTDDDDAVDATGDNSVTIEMIDHGYVVEGELAEGWTTFNVTNSGDEYHMIGIGKMKEGVELSDVVDALTSGEGETDAVTDDTEEQSLGTVQLISAQAETSETTVDEGPGGDGGEGGPGGEGGDPFEALFDDPEGLPGPPGGFLAPGESVSMTTDALDAGTYALICFISDPEGKPHFSSGMISEITVAESETPVGSAPTADVTVNIGAESVEVPTELEAGEHTFEVNLSDDAEHEFAFVRLNDADATFEELDTYFTEAFENEEGTIPTKADFADAPAVFTGFVFSLPEGGRYYVTKTLTAGTWMIGCTLEEQGESEGSPPGRDHGKTELARVTVS